MSAEPTVEEGQNMCVVRITTSVWRDNRGAAHLKKSLHFLERQCKGFSILEEDCSMTGVEEGTPKIINLDSVSDGFYGVEKSAQYRITMYW